MPRACQSRKHFILHPHAGEGVERAERFIEQEDFGMIDQRPGEGGALGHAAGEMMRIGVGETLPGRRGA